MATAVEGMEAILKPFVARVVVRPGNGFSRAMNQSLRSYPAIPEIIRRTAAWLARAEQAFNYSRVYVRTMHLYWHLVNEHDDWGVDVPVIKDAMAGHIEFERHASLPYNQFEAAMTIARRIGLVCGHGRLALSPDVLPLIRRQAALAAGSLAADDAR